MRIVAGKFRGRALTAPTTQTVRPTSDRLREAVFNVLSHAYDDPLGDARVLDLFAGTGALAIEALSRGAAFALFVDDSSESRSLIRANVDSFGLGGTSRLFRRDATRLGPLSGMAPFSLVFCDPPYGKGLAEQALSSARKGGWLTKTALCVVEEATASNFSWPDGFTEYEQRSYGETTVYFGGQDV